MAASAISPALRERLSTLQEQPGTAVASEDIVAIVEGILSSMEGDL